MFDPSNLLTRHFRWNTFLSSKLFIKRGWLERKEKELSVPVFFLDFIYYYLFKIL
ncbi:Hypothetical protein Minf_1761 [Methylacidiphilum infernorum V4]|uniref:Uncharacterized protein n=1 Tax=Methylacidiphilum infernorum (isolate V4) TaxID=481448 RepID=B3DXA6_METI4|nr:Hypothetical protein Minf_1761 [Methylacidiphilum infernorum V4]